MTSGTQKTPPQESLVGQTLCNGEYIIKRGIGHTCYFSPLVVLGVDVVSNEAKYSSNNRWTKM